MSYGKVTIADVVYANVDTHDSERSLAYHTYCETGHPYTVSAQRTRTHTCCRAFGSETVSLIVL